MTNSNGNKEKLTEVNKGAPDIWNDKDKICSLERKCEEPREGLRRKVMGSKEPGVLQSMGSQTVGHN